MLGPAILWCHGGASFLAQGAMLLFIEFLHETSYRLESSSASVERQGYRGNG